MRIAGIFDRTTQPAHQLSYSPFHNRALNSKLLRMHFLTLACEGLCSYHPDITIPNYPDWAGYRGYRSFTCISREPIQFLTRVVRQTSIMFNSTFVLNHCQSKIHGYWLLRPFSIHISIFILPGSCCYNLAPAKQLMLFSWAEDSFTFVFWEQVFKYRGLLWLVHLRKGMLLISVWPKITVCWRKFTRNNKICLHYNIHETCVRLQF